MAQHPYYDAIVAWAKGEIIQFRGLGGDHWGDVRYSNTYKIVDWNNGLMYRPKPKIKPTFIRVFQTKLDLLVVVSVSAELTTYEEFFKSVEKYPDFKRWLTPIQTVEIENE